MAIPPLTITIEECKEILLEFCKDLNRIPRDAEINNDKSIPSTAFFNKIFKRNGYKNGFRDYCKEYGYKVKNNKPSPVFGYSLNYEILCELFEEFHQKHGRYPFSKECRNENNLPAWNKIKKICGDRLDEFMEKYGMGKCIKKKEYGEYCEMVLEFVKILGRPPLIEDFASRDEYFYGMPDDQWFVMNCPDESVQGYNEFLLYLGLKPRRKVPKELATEIILAKYKELNRPLKKSDFDNIDWNHDIGSGTISKIWGSFNNMLRELGLPINLDISSDSFKTIQELKEDIIKLCNYIKETENRNILYTTDIKNCEWCLNLSTYRHRFKLELGMTIGQFIEALGFELPKPVIGIMFEFDDGEVVKSKFEYMTSRYFRSKEICFKNGYERDVRYKEFIPEYKGMKDCDYVINVNNKTWYVEVAGMLDWTKTNLKGKITANYMTKMIEKEQMLKSANLNYKIIYPKDLYDHPIEEVFSFLFD